MTTCTTAATSTPSRPPPGPNSLLATAPAAEQPRLHLTFSQELGALAASFGDRPARLGDILEATRGRGYDLLLVFITLPFLSPVPLPGLSVVLGLVIFMIGARLVMRRKPWLPKTLLNRELPARFLARALEAAVRVVRLLEYFLKPRCVFFHEVSLFQRLAGALIMISGLLLLLPLPVPFSNFLPGLTVLLVAAGALERDGLFFLAGGFMFLVTIAYFGAIAVGGLRLVEKLSHSLLGV